jgi:peptidoglycan/xylan/chitin deacetylase (PgdA/CDA1 family)
MRSPLQRIARTVASEAAGLLRLIKPARKGTLRVVYYHRIDDEAHRSCVRPKAFAEQMALLRSEGFEVLPLSSVRRHLDEHVPFPERAVVVTLDDGFADNFTHGLPTLVRESIPATVFLTAGYLDGPELPVLRDRSGVPPLTWNQAAEMAEHGIELGAHTLTHPTLPELDAESLRREIEGSRDLIEERTGRRPATFCYPRGRFDTRVKEAVREAGFDLACTTMPGCVTPDTHPFSLRRTFIAYDDSLRDFRKKLDGSFDLLHAARQRRQQTAAAG